MKLEDTLGRFQTSLLLCEGKACVGPIAILLNERKVVLREMSVVCPKAVWDLSGLHWAGSYFSTCCWFGDFLVMSLGKVSPIYLVLVVPQMWTFEHYKAAVEWSQRWVSLRAPPLTHAFRLTSSCHSCSLGSAMTLGQHAVPGRAVVLMLLLSVLFYTHFFVVFLPIHSIWS